MYSRTSFGSFYPVDSCVHRFNPIVKLINFIIVILLILLSNSLYINGFILILIFIMMLLSFVPFRFYINSIYSLRYIFILIMFICFFLRTSLDVCVVYMMKVTIVVEYLNILAFTTSPSETIYAIEKFLNFFNFLYLDVTKIAVKINSIIRYLPLYLSVENYTFKASASRGVDYNNMNIFKRTKVFFKVNSNVKRLVIYHNKLINECSSLRLYDIKKRRTNYRTNKVGVYDIFFLLFHLLLVYAYLVEEGII